MDYEDRARSTRLPVGTAPDAWFFVFDPPSVVPRIDSQAGLLSLYLSFEDDDFVWDYSKYLLEQERMASSEFVVKILVPKDHVLELSNELENVDINYSRLYPDAVGLGMSLTANSIKSMRKHLNARSHRI